MIGVLALALSLWSQDDPVNLGAAGAFYSYVDGRRYTFVVTRKDVEESPRWQEGADHPPLAPRAAIRAAQALMPRILGDGAAWRLNSVRLHPILAQDVWIYLVEFNDSPTPHSTGGIVAGPGKSVTIVVLMNGQAVAPRVDRQ